MDSNGVFALGLAYSDLLGLVCPSGSGQYTCGFSAMFALGCDSHNLTPD